MIGAERERLVIELLMKGVKPKGIAHQLKMSLRDIYIIRDKYFGTKEKELTTEHQAIILFKKKVTPPDAAIKLRISLDEANRFFTKYKDSFYLGQFGQDYKFIRSYIPQLAEICEVMKRGHLDVKELVDEYHLARDLGEMENRQLEIMRGNENLKSEKEALIEDYYALRSQKVSLENEIKSLKPQVEELERRYNLTSECLTYPQQNNYTQNYNQPYSWYFNRNY